MKFLSHLGKIILITASALILTMCSLSTAFAEDIPVTDPPETFAPATEAPVTEAPVTEPQVTEPPVTEAPETEPVYTEPAPQETQEATQEWTQPQTYDVNKLPTLPDSTEVAEDLPTAIGADSESGGVSLVGGIVCWIGVGVSLAVIVAFLLSTTGKNKAGIGRYESGNKIGGHRYQNNIRYK